MPAALLLALLAASPELAPEAQLALTSLSPGEKERVQAALGDPRKLPLYRGDFTVDPAQRLVLGKVAITLFPKKELRELYLRCTPNANHPGAVLVTTARANGKLLVLTQPDPSLYKVKVSALPGESVTVELELKARLPKFPEGGNALAALQSDGPGGDYGAFAASERVLSLVGLMPMVPAERDGKLFEGPSGIGDLGSFEPSNFLVSVATPAAWRAVSSGQALGEVPTGDGTVRYAYAVAAARELPLLVLKNAKVTTKKMGSYEIESVLLDDRFGTTVLETAGRALDALDLRLGPYPYKTLRVVEMPLSNGAGGMEFPGLITVSAGLVSGQTDPLEALGLTGEQAAMAQLFLGNALQQLMKNTLEFTIDHEVAHQYTAMLVGSDPIAEPIADEPLTQHLALLLLEWRHGKATAGQMRDGQLKSAYQMHRMLGGADGKANRPTHEYANNREYAALIYGKAPLLFDAQRELVGREAWERALKAYVDQNRYKWVTSRTFTELVAKQNPSSAKKLEALRQRWWNEAHGDEDLGTMDLEAMLGGQGGLQLDPKTAAEIEKLLRQLSGE